MAYHGETRIFYVDSYNRVEGTDTDFTVNIDIPKNNYNKVALLQASIPKSFYNFPDGQNTFTLIENGVNTIITIPVGDYGISSLIANLSQILTSSSSQNWTYNMSFPTYLQPQTGKITWIVSGNFGLQPSFHFQSNCFLQLGFNANTTYNFSGNSLISINYISLSPTNRLFIKSDICNTADNSILQEILEPFPDSSIIYYENINIENNSKDFTAQQSRNFSFTISDRFGIPINTNGLNVIMSIILFKKDDTSELHRQELLINNFERMLQIDEKLLKEFNTNPTETKENNEYKPINLLSTRNINSIG